MRSSPEKGPLSRAEDSSAPRACRRRSRLATFGCAAGIQLLGLPRAQAEDQAAYRYEFYKEDAGRVQVITHSALAELKLTSWLSLKSEVVYDAISGASPTGSPPPSQIHFVPPGEGGPIGPFLSRVPIAPLEDIRRGVTASATLSQGSHRLTPQFSYSEENDYISSGGALNYSLDLNKKNTTLNLGGSHNADRILPHGFLRGEAAKCSEEFLIGVNQLLGPKTVLTGNFTFGRSRGYLSDQYKGVLFESDPQVDPVNPALSAERRPGHRDRYIGFVSVTHLVAPLDGSVEASYRYFGDTYQIHAHTFGVAWLQNVGKHVVVAPLFRYYRQDAASFYGTRFPDYDTRPAHYSADYRLSESETFTLGVHVHVKATEWLGFDAGYKRYIMRGLDDVTSRSAYPSANIFTLGARIWF